MASENGTGTRLSYGGGKLSNPPSEQELAAFEDIEPQDLPARHKRDITSRVFVNREVRLDRIKFYGFDMDYTLAVYNSPAYEALAYDLAIERLISSGYPAELRAMKYDASFPIRGLFLDKRLGNLLKVDAFGGILVCVHGRALVSKEQLREWYPTRTVQDDQIGRRFWLLDTLFTLPEACLYADLVQFFEELGVRSREAGPAAAAQAPAPAAPAEAPGASASPTPAVPVPPRPRIQRELSLSASPAHAIPEALAATLASRRASPFPPPHPGPGPAAPEPRPPPAPAGSPRGAGAGQGPMRSPPVSIQFGLGGAPAPVPEEGEGEEGDSSGDEALGVQQLASESVQISYANLFQDVRAAMEHLHASGLLKEHTVKDLPKYVRKDGRLPLFLRRLRSSGAKVFLLTNSEYDYTHKIMAYMLGDYPPPPEEYAAAVAAGTGRRKRPGRSRTTSEDGSDPTQAGAPPAVPSPSDPAVWISYFDIVIVNARKPLFFKEGTSLRQVDTSTGRLMLSAVSGPLALGRVYSGGSLDMFRELTGARGHEVLYIGDHIFADILKSRKTSSWRTLLIVRELDAEIASWRAGRSKYIHLLNLEHIRAEVYRELDSSATRAPDISSLLRHIRHTQEALDHTFNAWFGGLFRSGSKQTFFSMQVQRYADLYASDFLHLMEYPLFYFFSLLPAFLPHEHTQREGEVVPGDSGGGRPAPRPRPDHEA
eukprot:tig00001373_g8446.t1